MPTGAVFLSYASEDSEAAARIAEALKRIGIEVWFDRSELRGGDVWDAAIREQIRTCALFIPLISQHALARPEGYFRLEWKLAIDRSYLMSTDRSFLLPVAIDGSSDSGARIPDRFREVQWLRLSNGEPGPEFLSRVQALLVGAAPPPAPPSRSTISVSPRRLPGRRVLTWAAVAVACLIVAAVSVRYAHRPGTAGEAPAGRSIAVLPFADMSAKHDQEYFADGLAEELIDLLTRDSSLKVAARTSCFYFKNKQATIHEIARTLGVTHVLEGSVRMQGDTVRVTIQLIRADDGFHVWSSTYERKINDVLRIQDDIAGAVTDALRATLRPGDPRGALSDRDANAHARLLQARYLVRRGSDQDAREALHVLDEAISDDPGYAPAWAARAALQRYLSSFVDDTPDAAMGHARADAARALALDAHNAQAHEVRAAIALFYDFDPVEAGREMDAAQRDGSTASRLGIAVWSGCVLDQCFSELERSLAESIERDPLNEALYRNRANIRYLHGDLELAERDARSAIEMAPANGYSRHLLVRILLARHEVAAAVSTAFGEESPSNYTRAAQALALAAAGRHADAEKALQQLISRDGRAMAYQVAQVYALRSQTDLAIEWLERAYRAHDSGLWLLKVDPLLVGVRQDVRGLSLLRRLRMTD